MRALFLLIPLLFIGCKTIEYVPVEKVKIEYRDKIEKDSIYVNDSIYIHEKGDTVYFEKWHTKYIERLRVDSIVKVDSIPVPYEVEKIVKVEKSLSWWQKLRINLGGVFVALIGAGGVYLFIKNKSKIFVLIKKIISIFA